jgi:hypothetical protein
MGDSPGTRWHKATGHFTDRCGQEDAMSHNTLFKVVAGVLALSAGLAFTPVGAQTSTTKELVTTACTYGQVTECGTKPAQTTCTLGISVTPNAGLWGFSLSFGTCATSGSINLYKDYYKGTSGGTCVQTIKYPADATSTSGTGDQVPELSGEVEESC